MAAQCYAVRRTLSREQMSRQVSVDLFSIPSNFPLAFGYDCFLSVSVLWSAFILKALNLLRIEQLSQSLKSRKQLR
jgi:hypothetical protein